MTGRSRHDWTLFTSHFAPHQTFPEFANRRVVEVDKVPVDRSVKAVAQAAVNALRLRLPLEGFDALVVVCEGIGDLVVFRNDQCPTICVCLTPLRLVFDPEYRARAMDSRGAIAKLLINVASKVFCALDRRAWRRYERVFCISEEAKRRAIAGGLVAGDRAEVLHVGLGVDSAAASDVFERFFLIPGRIMWTKNIQLGIEAFRRLLARTPVARDFKLVIAGIVDKKSEPYLAALRAAAVDLPVEFRIFPSDAELAKMYHTCYGVLFTAFNEDWGIVPLEAMAFGKPVIAVNAGGPRETVSPGVTGFLEEPTAEAFAVRMAQLVGDPAEARRMGSMGHQHSRRYSWKTFTDRIDAAIDDLGGAPDAVAATLPAKPELGPAV
jgi:glycosyltransferase involved in cell wall biosynthesis